MSIQVYDSPELNELNGLPVGPVCRSEVDASYLRGTPLTWLDWRRVKWALGRYLSGDYFRYPLTERLKLMGES